MAIASTNAVGVYVNAEATWGETPTSVDMQQLRFTGESLVFGKQTVQSETIRADRMRDQMALVGFETQGDLNFEFAFFDYDAFISGALFGDWVGAKTVTGTTISFTSSTIADSGTGFGNIPVGAYVWVTGSTTPSLNRRYRVTAATAGALTVSPAPATTAVAGPSITISSSAVQVVTAATTLIATFTATTKSLVFSGSTGFNPATGTGFAIGQFVRLSGFAQAANNGVKRITAVNATTLTFAETCADETVTAATTLKFVGRRLRNSTTQKSFHIEKAFTDISQYMSFRGMRVGNWKLDVNAAEIITGSFSFMGKTVVRNTVATAATTVASNVSPVMTGSAHVGVIYQNGVALAAGIKQIQLEVENNLRNSEQIGSLYPYAIGYGFQDVSGQVDAYFEDATLYDQLINHTSTELSWTTTDDSGNAYVITLPAVLFTEGYPQAGGGNDDVMIPLAFQAVRSATYDCQIQIDAIPSLT